MHSYRVHAHPSERNFPNLLLDCRADTCVYPTTARQPTAFVESVDITGIVACERMTCSTSKRGG